MWNLYRGKVERAIATKNISCIQTFWKERQGSERSVHQNIDRHFPGSSDNIFVISSSFSRKLVFVKTSQNVKVISWYRCLNRQKRRCFQSIFDVLANELPIFIRVKLNNSVYFAFKSNRVRNRQYEVINGTFHRRLCECFAELYQFSGSRKLSWWWWNRFWKLIAQFYLRKKKEIIHYTFVVIQTPSLKLEEKIQREWDKVMESYVKTSQGHCKHSPTITLVS